MHTDTPEGLWEGALVLGHSQTLLLQLVGTKRHLRALGTLSQDDKAASEKKH